MPERTCGMCLWHSLALLIADDGGENNENTALVQLPAMTWPDALDGFSRRRTEPHCKLFARYVLVLYLAP